MTDVTINIMPVKDDDNSYPIPIEFTVTGNVIGLNLGGREVLFSVNDIAYIVDIAKLKEM